MSAKPQSLWCLRPMTQADIAAVVAVEAASYQYPWSAGVFEDCLRVGYHAWVAQDRSGCVMGHGLMTTAVGEAHLLNLCVHPQVQRSGLGREFMQHLMDVALAESVGLMYLEVRPSNEAALKLYRRLGFREAGLRRAYYPAQRGREDAVVLVYDFR